MVRELTPTCRFPERVPYPPTESAEKKRAFESLDELNRGRAVSIWQELNMKKEKRIRINFNFMCPSILLKI